MILEIGGYFSLECGPAKSRRPPGRLLNSGSNALKAIIRTLGVTEISVPYYTCPVVWRALESEGVVIVPYDIGDDLLPTERLDPDRFAIYTNYFGVCAANAARVAAAQRRLILDNAQAWYAKPIGKACFYSPRKFFGLPDGGVAVCDPPVPAPSERAVSHDRCAHLLMRHDLPAAKGYSTFQANEERLAGEPVMAMSNLTEALLAGLDQDWPATRRRANWQVLAGSLAARNELRPVLDAACVPLVYPLLTSQAGVRERLIGNGVFVPRYWPVDGSTACLTSDRSRDLAARLIPLPVDQRYDQADMRQILEVIG